MELEDVTLEVAAQAAQWAPVWLFKKSATIFPQERPTWNSDNVGAAKAAHSHHIALRSLRQPSPRRIVHCCAIVLFFKKSVTTFLMEILVLKIKML
jgi:hypothetical protein